MEIGIIVILIVIIGKIKIDFDSWLINEPINHSLELIVCGLWYSVFSMPFLTAELKISGLMSIVITTFLICSWHWFLFDGFYNLIRKRHTIKTYGKQGLGDPPKYGFFYTGSDDPSDANSDNFLQKLKLWQHIALKMFLITISTFLYIYNL